MSNLIKTVLRLGLLIVSTWLERNKRVRKIKKEAISDVKKGLKEDNYSLVSASFDRIDRM